MHIGYKKRNGMNTHGSMKFILLALALIATGAAVAGSLDAPAAPESPNSAMFTLEDIFRKIDSQGSNVTKRTGGFTEPAAGPTNGTMHTLNDIMALVTNRAPVAKTGQTNSILAYDDGTTQTGVAWPTNRFTIQADTNCVRDNLTGLIWARNMYLLGTATNWTAAAAFCTNLNAQAYCGYSDWRLPTIRELMSVIDYSSSATPPLPAGHPFVNAQGNRYWSSTIRGNPWHTYMGSGNSGGWTDNNDGAAAAFHVWPVRGGRR